MELLNVLDHRESRLLANGTRLASENSINEA